MGIENLRIDFARTQAAGSLPGLASLELHCDDALSRAAARARLAAAGRAATGSIVVGPAGLLWDGLTGPRDAAPAPLDHSDAPFSPFVRHRRELRHHFYVPTMRLEGRI